jgi:hypothetical protein
MAVMKRHLPCRCSSLRGITESEKHYSEYKYMLGQNVWGRWGTVLFTKPEHLQQWNDLATCKQTTEVQLVHHELHEKCPGDTRFPFKCAEASTREAASETRPRSFPMDCGMSVVCTLSLTYHRKKNSRFVKSRDHNGQDIYPLRPIQFPG